MQEIYHVDAVLQDRNKLDTLIGKVRELGKDYFVLYIEENLYRSSLFPKNKANFKSEKEKPNSAISVAEVEYMYDAIKMYEDAVEKGLVE